MPLACRTSRRSGKARAVVAGSLLLAGGALCVAAWGPWGNSRAGGSGSLAVAPVGARVSIAEVFRPGLKLPVAEMSAADRETILRRLAPRPDANLSILLHSLHLYGPETRVPERGTGGTARILDLMFDSDRGQRHFGASRALLSTRYGARFPVHETFFLGTNQRGAEAHPGQSLAILSALGLPTTQPIRLAGGQESTLQAVFDDLVANFVLDGEIYWDVMPLILYAPPTKAWKNKFGKEFTFDDAARELLSRSLSGSPCAGTHQLTNLVVMLRVDTQTPILSDAVRGEIREYLGLVSRTLTECQRPQGYWDALWYQNMPGSKPINGRAMVGLNGEVLATGHHLEWMLLLPDDLRPPPEVFARGARWLTRVLLEETKDARWVSGNYCPVVHAARSALVLSGAARAE